MKILLAACIAFVLMNSANADSLHRAAGQGDVEAIQKFLDHGSNPNAQNKDGVTPLHLAAAFGHADAINVLVTYGADPNSTTEAGMTLSIPSIFYRTANILLYSLCWASMVANSSSNGRSRCVGQLGICS